MDIIAEFDKWIEDRPLHTFRLHAQKVVYIRRIVKEQPKLFSSRTQHPLYGTWQGMKSRCSNPNNKNYQDYGARGISVCSRWCESFNAFVEDMGPKPDPEYSIDRINVYGNYEPQNCRWATKVEQAQNRRNSPKYLEVA